MPPPLPLVVVVEPNRALRLAGHRAVEVDQLHLAQLDILLPLILAGDEGHEAEREQGHVGRAAVGLVDVDDARAVLAFLDAPPDGAALGERQMAARPVAVGLALMVQPEHRATRRVGDALAGRAQVAQALVVLFRAASEA